MDTSLKMQRRRAAKPMLWIGMASMAMAFIGLTSGYIVSRSALMARNIWVNFEIPSVFYTSTAIIVLSSVLMVFVTRMAKKGNVSVIAPGIFGVLGLGIIFTVLQFVGWKELTDSGIYFTGNKSNTSGSWFYVITWFHLLHILAGIIVLLVTGIKASLGKYSKGDVLGIEMASIFWHFLDALWIYLFLFLSFIR